MQIISTRKCLRLIKENPDFVRLARGLFHFISSGTITETVADVFNDWKGVMTEIVVRGQDISTVRKDIPLDLLVNILWSIGEAVDFWIFSHIDEFSAEELERHAKLYIDLYKRISSTEAGLKEES